MPFTPMNLLERIPTRWLLAGAALACLVLWTAPSVAQTVDPVEGKLLFEDTSNQSGNAQLGTCTNCHQTIQNRRTAVGGSAFADISFDRAMTRFGAAIGGNFGGVMGQFAQLSSQQIQNVAAYIADTPKVTATGLSESKVLAFEASASGVSVIKNVVIHHSIATTDNLQITGVNLSAGGSTFMRSSACNGTTRLPGASCTFSVTYTPTSTAPETRTLTVNLQQGTVAFTRPITLSGSVAGAVTPTPPSTPSDDSGGGALGWAWLTGLAMGTAALARRRCT